MPNEYQYQETQKAAVHLQAITSNVYLCFIWNNIISIEFQTNSTFWIYKKKYS